MRDMSGAMDSVYAVQRMQDLIEERLQEPLTLEDMAEVAGYSPWHASRLFKELVGITPFEYLRARRLSAAAMRLRDTSGKVLDVALDSSFESHEGFTRAFSRRFGMTPEAYQKQTPPLKLLMPGSVRDYYLYLARGECKMTGKAQETCTNIVYTQVIEKPARKLILMRGQKATEYWTYCEEVGCDVWGVLSSIKGALGEPIGMWLPKNLCKPNTSVYAQGVEVSAEYDGPVPEGMEIIELPSCKMMVFQGQPYADEDMGEAIGVVTKAIDDFNPGNFGWEWADEEGPRYQLAPLPHRGYIEARPVRSIA